MLPKTINGLVAEFDVISVEHIGHNRTGEIDHEQCRICILESYPLSWQSHILIHELVHLAFALNHGLFEREDEREEYTCVIIGRFLPKVLVDNPDLLDGDPQYIDVLGELWKVKDVAEPDPDSDGSAGWLSWRDHTMYCRAGSDSQIRRMRRFQMTCEAILAAVEFVEDYRDFYYRQMSATLFALLRANPQVHPRAVMSSAPDDE